MRYLIRNQMRTEAINTQRQQGFSMIEILVSVFVTAFALLGLAALQFSSVNTTNFAYTQSQSMMVITELVDQMRSNVDAAKSDAFDIAPATGGALKSFADVYSDTDAPPSGATEIDKIKFYWFENINRTLPDAKAAIDCNSSGMCAIKVQYSNIDKDKASSNTTLEQVISVQL